MNEGKFCLFFERVIELYRVVPAPASKKQKRGPNEAAVPTAAEDAVRRGVGPRHILRADDRDEDAAGAPISTSTLDVWVAAVMELYRRQCSMRPNCYPTPAGRAHQQDRHVPARPRRPQAGCLRQPWPGWHRRRVQRRGVLGPATLPARPQPGQDECLPTASPISWAQL